MNICFAVDKIPKYKIGGAERQFFIIGKELASRGHDVHMTCRRFGPDQPAVEQVEGITVHSYGPPPGEKGKVREYLQTKQEFLSALHAADCDVYHNTPASPLTGWTRLYSKLTGRPFAFTLAHENDHTPKHWEEKSVRRRQLYYYGLRNADSRIVLADYMKEGLAREYELDSRVIRYGYPIPDDASFDDKGKDVVWMARVVDWKRPELFVRLAEQVEADDWTFHLIGPSEDEGYYEKIRRRCEDVENLEFHGPVEPGKDMEWYKRASLFVNTSTSEGFPNTYIQSWISGTPVAALEVDPDGLIGEHEAGVTPCEFNEFVERVEALLKDPDLLRERSQHARSLGKEFDVRRTANQYLEEYGRIL